MKSNKPSKNSKMWQEKYKNSETIINRTKMLKLFNCLGLDILALGYSSQFFLIYSQHSKLMKYL